MELIWCSILYRSSWTKHSLPVHPLGLENSGILDFHWGFCSVCKLAVFCFEMEGFSEPSPSAFLSCGSILNILLYFLHILWNKLAKVFVMHCIMCNHLSTILFWFWNWAVKKISWLISLAVLPSKELLWFLVEVYIWHELKVE